ncbi:MAG: MATE family efflux transporter [Myxococcaceae bacterium]
MDSATDIVAEGQLRSDGALAELSLLSRLAGPIALANAGHALMGVVSTAVMGRVGAAEQGAVGLGNGLFFTVTALGLGLMMGLDPLISQAFGARQPVRARQLFWQGVYLALAASAVLALPIALMPLVLSRVGMDPEIVSAASSYLWWRLPSLLPIILFFGARSYLQAAGRPQALVWATGLANAVNLCAVTLFALGGSVLPSWAGPLRAIPAMGATGAAVATDLCMLMQLGVLLVAIRRVKLPALLPDRRPVGADMLRAFKLGLPVGLQVLAEVGLFAFVGLLAGRLGKESLAAHQVAITYASFSFCIALGIGEAGSVRVGWAIGARDSEAARRSGLVAFAAAALFMTIPALAFLLIPEQLALLMTDKPEVVPVAVALFTVTAVFQIADGVQAVGSGVLRGAGDTRAGFIANMIGYYAVGLPLAMVLGLWLAHGVVGLWWGLCAGLFIVALVLFRRFWRLTGRPVAPL